MDGHAISISPSSLHEQVTRDLLARVQGGEFPQDRPIPTEAALCQEYGVSRITIRRAMAALVERRLIVRRPGIGSFVTGRPADLREFHLVGFLDEKLEFAHEIVLNEVVPAEPRIAAALGIEPGSPVRHIRGVVHRDHEPFTVTDNYTADLPGQRLAESDFSEPMPSAQALGKRLGRRIGRAEQELDAVAADADAAHHLDLAPGTPVIRARRVYFSADDRPIQYLVVRYHPGRYRFVVDLVPRPGTTAFTAPSVTADRGRQPVKARKRELKR